jgi:F0F1-type ATP synthase assembly protein I
LPPPDPIVRYGRYGAVAFEFSGTIAGGVVVGALLDRWIGSQPWATVTCTLLAVVGGFIRLITILRRFDRSDVDAEP